MRPLSVLALVPVLALAACQTPREACLSQASSRLRTVDALIRETQGNLDRGFAIEHAVITHKAGGRSGEWTRSDDQ